MSGVTVLAIDIGGTKIAAGLVRFAGKPEVGQFAVGQPVVSQPVVNGTREIPTQASKGGAFVLQSVIALAKQIIADAGEAVQGVGVGSAGVVDPATGAILSATDLIPGWAGTALGQALREATGLPVSVVGDVVAHGIGEAQFGAASGAGSCLTVGVGTGIGGALVIDGEVNPGANGVAGHVGHVQAFGAENLDCSCGRRGHLEPMSSGTGITDRYFVETGERLSGREIEALAVEGDRAAQEVTVSAGYALGQALGSLANAMDPEVIVLSGSVTRSGAHWWDAVRGGYADQAMDPVAGTPIIPGELGGDAPLLGAAYVASQMLAGQTLAGQN